MRAREENITERTKQHIQTDKVAATATSQAAAEAENHVYIVDGEITIQSLVNLKRVDGFLANKLVIWHQFAAKTMKNL